ncbi:MULTISPECIES: hypothetical protein [Halobacillus]|uniref:Uncharacterized protein n=1 Tax=Halobacillus halophilus (strain ATCC 35676 / DSM 2266 / JCM 20832 / KCTC 3685 / LMG 17431 / NBRC 102448 / NCIMB 2269) TaxID=866895 RepID=I0JKW8_HALH3|nr:hypothetical protein [Halobacillus halophilus]ASF38913.1 hypothetical protein CEH05_07220 [Halobacillus halophilus]CCG44788.1 hypothetical protein HBHAL_2444 [Halobacillus halophilus DSM 2266]
MSIIKTLVGIFFCALFTFVGIYRLNNETLNNFPFIVSIAFTIGCPIGILIMTIKVMKAKKEGNLY